MSALNMGFAQLQIVPVMTGFNSTIKKEIGSAFPTLGKQAGADFGKGVASGFSAEKKSLESEVKALEKNLASAQDNLKKAKGDKARATEKETDALKKLEIAELKLQEVRDSGKAKASQLATAEENVRQKQLALTKAQEESHRTAVTLENATEDLSTANDKLRVATDKANKETAETTTSTDKAKKGLKSVKEQAENTRGGLGKLGKYMAGAFAGAIAAVSFSNIIGGMKEAIELAGQYQQSVGAIDSIFKEQSGKMHANAGNAAVNVGLDKNAYNELGSVLGAQLKNAGTPMDQLADKTSNLITLGADLSSMFGGTTKEAIEAVSSALKGEMDPIEKYGITLSAAALEAEALSKGLIKPVVDADLVSDAATKMQVAQKKYNDVVKKHGKDSMEAAKAQVSLNSAERAYDKATAGKVPKLEGEAKALAVQSALYSQSADAQGNFAKESNTLEGQQQRLNAEITNMKIAAGTAFIPAMTNIVSVIRSTVIPALQGMGQWIKDNQAWLKPLAVAIASAAGAFLLFKGVTAIIFGITKAVALFKGGFAALNVVMKANVFVLIASAIAGLVAGFVYLWKTNETFRNFFIGIWQSISTFFVGIWQNYIKPAFQAISNFIQCTLVPIFQWFYQNIVLPVWNAIKLVIGVVITAIIGYIKMWIWIWQNVLAPAISFVWENILKPVFHALGKFFVWVWNTLLKPAFNALKVAFQAVGKFLKWVWDVILKPVFDALGKFFKWVWETYLRPAFQNMKNNWKSIIDTMVYVWNVYLKPMFIALWRYVTETLLPRLKSGFQRIRDAWEAIKRPFQIVWTFLRDVVFNPLKNLITKTIPNAFKTGVDFIKKAWDKVANIARKPINFVIETVYGGLRNTFNSVADKLKLPNGWRLPEVKPLGEFYTGGYTGPGNKYDYAGDVHAGEYVLRKEATSKLRRVFGLKGLDHMNKFGTLPGYSSGGFVRPVKGGRYTSRFGEGRGRYPHAGLDIAVPIGTSVFSPLDGTVRVAKTNAVTGRSGIGILIDHANGISTYQGHLSRLIAQAGQQVKAGEKIALSGNTGKSTGPHVHSEVWVNGKPIDPFNYINGGAIPTGGSGGGALGFLQPLFDLKDKIFEGFRDKFREGGMMTEIGLAAGKNLVSAPIDWIKEKAEAIGDVAQDVWGNTKDFFNGKDSDVQAAVRGVAAGYGWNSGRHWDSLSKLIGKESSWNPNAQNRGSTAYGLFQFLNSTWAGVGASKTSDPAGQARAGLKYISQRYGNPEKAWAFWKKNHWYAKGGLAEHPTKYDNGGWLQPGRTDVVNLTKKPEAIFTAGQWKVLSKIVDNQLSGTSQVNYNISVPEPAFTAEKLVSTVQHHNRVIRRGGN